MEEIEVSLFKHIQSCGRRRHEHKWALHEPDVAYVFGHTVNHN